VSCRIDVPSVHVPSRESRERKTLCGLRDALVGSRTSLWIATLSFVWMIADVVGVNGRRVRRRPRLGGLLNFYERGVMVRSAEQWHRRAAL
jgi:hypothetical protein